MDELKIRTNFMKRTLEKIITKMIKKNLGLNIYPTIEDLTIKNQEDGYTTADIHVTVQFDAEHLVEKFIFKED